MAVDRGRRCASGLAIAVLILTGCGKDDGTSPPSDDRPPSRLTTVGVVPATAQLSFIGDTIRFRADVWDQYAEIMSGIGVTWSSSDTSVAYIDATGLATARAAGTARVSATANDHTGEARVDVRVVVTRLEFATDTVDLDYWEKPFASGVMAYDLLGRPTPVTSDIILQSSDPDVLRVQGTRIVGVSDGVVSLVASLGDMADTATVVVAAIGRVSVIQAGDKHSCGLDTTGRAYCWGQGKNGRLGAGDTIGALSPRAVASGSSFSRIAVGFQHSCAIEQDGPAYCWGLNTNSQLGSPGLEQHAPTPVGGGLAFRAIAAGWDHSCGIATDGRAYCWGANGSGQLGDGSYTSRSGPVAVAGGLEFTSISAGYVLTCAISVDSKAYCWGLNQYGGLGIGTTGGQSTLPREVSGGHDFVQVDAGQYYACGVTSSGDGYCWGAAAGREPAGTFPAPTPIVGNFKVSQISAHEKHYCATTPDGRGYCYGVNDRGQLGSGGGGWSRRIAGVGYEPIQVVGGAIFAAIEVGENHTCATTVEGSGLCWGWGPDGQLGQAASGPALQPVRVDSELPFIRVSLGAWHACALTEDFRAYCWGWNRNGQTGTGRGAPRVPMRVQGGHEFMNLAAGWEHTCAADAEGQAWCWGQNRYYVLGFGGGWGDAKFAPNAVLGEARFKQIDGNQYATCGVTLEDRIYCWGSNTEWVLGGASERTPPSPIASIKSYRVVSTGDGHTCGILEDGGLECWGRNLALEMGKVGLDRSRTPVAITPPLDLVTVSSRGRHSCALSAAGDISCWGSNASGELGIGAIGGARRFAERPAVGAKVVDVAAGSSHTCAATENGDVFCWGLGEFGQIGIGNGRTVAVPTRVAVPGRVVRVGAGLHNSCAVNTDGEIYCWGDNRFGQIGSGASSLAQSPQQLDGGFTFMTARRR
jgi:alpha-tubulin suppressor-like RCC1 family protein